MTTVTPTNTSYFSSPANVIEMLKWLVPFILLFTMWCIKIEVSQTRYDFRITEITHGIENQNRTLTDIQNTLKSNQTERTVRMERLAAIEAKVDLILQDKYKK